MIENSSMQNKFTKFFSNYTSQSCNTLCLFNITACSLLNCTVLPVYAMFHEENAVYEVGESAHIELGTLFHIATLCSVHQPGPVLDMHYISTIELKCNQ